MKPDTEKLRKKYMDNPSEGMTSEDIRHVSEDELLDMDLFHSSFLSYITYWLTLIEALS